MPPAGPEHRQNHLAALKAKMGRPVSGLSLAVFRIALGALLVWDCWRFIRYDRIYRYFVAPDFHFTYAGFGWVVPLPEPWIHLAWLFMGLMALLVMLGLFYRTAILGLTVSFSYFFLLDAAQYLNHFYLVILFLVLMCFLPANRVLSLDARFWPRLRGPTIPYAAVVLIRAQMEIMLIFAGLVKLTPDWLAGAPLDRWLRARADAVPLGFLFQYDGAILVAAWGTVALHLIGAPLLLWRRTRLMTFIAYCVFHSANAQLFNIGIFPWLTIAATTIFFAPDWPRRAARWLLGLFETLPSQAPEYVPMVNGSRPGLSTMALAGMALWLAVQVALPLRSLAFPTEVRWTGDGHRFSWRMRIFDRDADGVFTVVADGVTWVVEPTDYLTDRQAGKMLVRPDMIHQFAGHLETIWHEAGYSDIAVHADINKSLNGRPYQPFIDPKADLADLPLHQFGPDLWVLPLQVPVWGLAHARKPAQPILQSRHDPED